MRLILLLCVLSLVSAVRADDAAIEVTAGKSSVVFSGRDGSIVSIGEKGKTGAVFHGGEFGLWQLRFADGKTLSASAWDGKAKDRTLAVERMAGGVKMTFAGPEAQVIVTASPAGDAVELRAIVTAKDKAVLDVALPARLRFEPADVVRFVSPLSPHAGVGAAFNHAFFEKQSPETPSAWELEHAGPKGVVSLFGKGLKPADMNNPAVELTITDEGKKWLSQNLVKKLAGAKARVSRSTPRDVAQVVLVDSADGPYVCGSNLGGKGLLWRVGGPVDLDESPNVLRIVGSVIDHLVWSGALPERHKIGVLRMTNGPIDGALASVAGQEWVDRLKQFSSKWKRPAEVVEITSPAEMLKAVSSEEYVAIVNPYGEALPVGENQTLAANVQAVGQYVKAGGNWFETGGYSFHAALQASKYLSYQSPYPPIFADFQHLDAKGGSVSVYRVQPRTWAPWAGAADPAAILIPGKLACGGDEVGGYAERFFCTFAKPGQAWQTPMVRLVAGHTAAEDLRVYGKANAINRSLAQKVSPELLEKLKTAVLLKLDGNLSQMSGVLDLLPTPTLIHSSDYLQGGFDKQYPDHLPPRADFGTSEAFKAFLADVHHRGLLFMPYTNPTWWCDHPRGPTFVREGEAPLTRDLDGKLIYEKYSKNDGWTICFWHPAVKAANALTLEQFTREYPSDVLFEDQCGARTWRYDTNAASPTPYAYAEGSLCLIDEECKTAPLSTEDCYDRVLNAETQVCGMTFALMPSRREQSFARLFKHQFHPRVWEIYPVDQILGHDKAIFCHHDLGAFVLTPQAVSWTLGLGFAMSDRASAAALTEDKNLQWLKWLDRIQKSVCARYIGQPVVDFTHDRGPTPSAEEDGVIRATYGDVKIIANLSDTARTEEGHQLAAHGFYASAPGMTAGNLRRVGDLDMGEDGVSFVAESSAGQTDVWVLSEGARQVAVELPAAVAGRAMLTLDGQAAQAVQSEGKTLRFTLPSGPRKLWHGKAAT